MKNRDKNGLKLVKITNKNGFLDLGQEIFVEN